MTVTVKGRVTFHRRVHEHLGAIPGERLRVMLLSGGRVELRAASRSNLESFIGSLACGDHAPVSVEEMALATAFGWANER